MIEERQENRQRGRERVTDEKQRDRFGVMHKEKEEDGKRMSVIAKDKEKKV